MARELKLKTCIAPLLDMYDYILIDCPPSLGLLTINSLTASDGFIVPLQTEYFAMEGLAQLLQTVETIKGSLNEKLDLVGILLTLFDSRNNLHKQVSGEIRKHFGPKVFDSIIPRNVKLSECPSFGKPIILYDIESRGSEAYLSLAKEIILMEREQKIEEPVQELNEEPVQELSEERVEEIRDAIEEVVESVRELREETTNEAIVEPAQELREETKEEVEIPPVIEDTPASVFTEKTEDIETTKHS